MLSLSGIQPECGGDRLGSDELPQQGRCIPDPALGLRLYLECLSTKMCLPPWTGLQRAVHSSCFHGKHSAFLSTGELRKLPLLPGPTLSVFHPGVRCPGL